MVNARTLAYDIERVIDKMVETKFNTEGQKEWFDYFRSTYDGEGQEYEEYIDDAIAEYLESLESVIWFDVLTEFVDDYFKIVAYAFTVQAEGEIYSKLNTIKCI
jgi:hypothetical protein